MNGEDDKDLERVVSLEGRLFWLARAEERG